MLLKSMLAAIAAASAVGAVSIRQAGCAGTCTVTDPYNRVSLAYCQGQPGCNLAGYCACVTGGSTTNTTTARPITTTTTTTTTSAKPTTTTTTVAPVTMTTRASTTTTTTTTQAVVTTTPSNCTPVCTALQPQLAGVTWCLQQNNGCSTPSYCAMVLPAGCTAPTTTTTTAPATTTTTSAAPVTTTTSNAGTTTTGPTTTIPVPTSPFLHEKCRPDGLERTNNLDVPYCSVYDENGREKLPNGLAKRVIGYFTAWRTGLNGQARYLASDIPWENLSHINYAFAHIQDNKVSVGGDIPSNAATGLTWPGVDIDSTLGFKGHFGALATYKKRTNGVKTLVSIGGWAETGGYFADDGTRVANGGYYEMTKTDAGILTFAKSCVDFIRKYQFDGVDIDYEYPTSMFKAGNPDDFALSDTLRATLSPRYVVLMRTLREELDKASVADGKHYLLSIASPSSGYMLRGMEMMQVTRYLDYVNMMTYDLHGAWNNYVGHNAALFDTGLDAELAAWKVYTTEQYGGIGYLNTDWAFVYFRGNMPAGRINIGVPFYSRGWQNVVPAADPNGLWGSAAFPNQTRCPPGTGGSDTNKCGNGAMGIDNIWHDTNAQGDEVGAGSNPMWHCKNLENGVYGSYLSMYGFPANGNITSTYTRNYDSVAVAPWLWNNNKKVFLSTEDEQSIARKIQYVNDKGAGGLMMWELAGDYDCYAKTNGVRGAKDSTACGVGKSGEYYIGSKLTGMMKAGFAGASPYGNKVADPAWTVQPTQAIKVDISITNFKVGDQNYPLNPRLVIANKGATAIPGNTEIQFTVPASTPDNMGDQSGAGLKVIKSAYTGTGNVGGLRGELHRVSLKVPGWKSITAGRPLEIDLKYYMPITFPSNFHFIINGTVYGSAYEYPNLPVLA